MRRLLPALLLCASATWAAGLDLGVMLGEPTGLSGKYWLDKNHAVDGGLAWSLSDDQDLHLHGDYLIHKHGVLPEAELPGGLAFYYGFGGRLQLREDDDDGRDENDDKDKLGLRIPLGLEWSPNRDLRVFVEVVPVVDLLPDTEAGFNGALGLRFRLR